MKQFVAIFMTVILLFLMVGCGSSPQKAPDSKAPDKTSSTDLEPSKAGVGDDWQSEKNIKLRWAFWADAAGMEYWQQGLDGFMDKYPNVEILVENVAWPNYWDNLSVQVASKTMPDITGMTSGTSRAYLSNDSLLNLTPYMEADSKDPDSGWNTDDYFEGVFDSYTYDDKVYAVPYDVGTSALILNMDILNKYGDGYPDCENWTFDDLWELAKKVTIDENNDGNADIYGLAWSPKKDNAMWEPFVLSVGGEFFKGEEPNQTIDIPNETGDIIQKLADGIKEGWNYNQTEAQDLGLFNAGKIAITAGNPTEIRTFIENGAEFEIDIALTPRINENASYKKFLGGGGFSAAASTEHPDLCWEFIKYYCRAENIAVCTAQSWQGIPPLRTVLDEFTGSKYATKHAEYYFWHLNQSPVAGKFITCPNWNAVNDTLGTYCESVYAGKTSGLDAMDKFRQEAAELMKQGD